MNRYDFLVSRAEMGTDPRAINLKAELDRYFEQLESETKQRVKQCIDDLSYVIVQPEAVSIESTETAAKIVKIGLQMGKIIDPSFGDDHQIVNG